jgi:hypothetical protein
MVLQICGRHGAAEGLPEVGGLGFQVLGALPSVTKFLF